MSFAQPLIVGSLALALPMTAYLADSSMRQDANASASMNHGQQVRLCVKTRQQAFKKRPMTSTQRRAIQLDFRACVKAATNGSHMSSKRSSSSSSIRSSASSMSSSATSSSMSSSTQSSVSSSMSSSASSQAANEVRILDFEYHSDVMFVKRGTTVTWTNDDNAPHTVTSHRSGGPSSGQLSKGQSYSFTFNDTGTYRYYCTLHPEMQAVVVVTH